MLSADEWDAVSLSLKVASVATLASLVPGLAVAFLLARVSFPGKFLLNAFVHLPLVLPPVVTGYMLLLSFGRRAPLGQFLDACCGLVFSFRWTGAALASAVMAFPLLVRAVRLSFESVDPRLESAAATLGASPAWVFFTITLPLSMAGILAGALLCFAKALGEFGATVTFVSNIPGETRTLASAIYTFTQVPGGDGAALRLTVIAVVIAVAALAASEALAATIQRRGAGR